MSFLASSSYGEQAAVFPQVVRGVLGGVLMGIANLVPGISGGTMLLAAGVYPQFVSGIAEVSTLRFRPRTLLVLGAIGGAAALAIVLLAGVIKALVVDHRWAMYSLFIGLTLGGVPVVWGLIRRLTPTAAAAGAAGVALMAAMALLQPGAATEPGGREYLMLFLAGLAGASAMIVPGVSGGYLLLVLGQYITILGAIDSAKNAVLGPGGADWPQVLETLHVIVPVGIGVALGVVGVSNAVRYFLDRFEKATLGFLLGLLLGAVIGLWPFQRGRLPEPGEIIKGKAITMDAIAQLRPEDYPLEVYPPDAAQAIGAFALILAGFGTTQLVAWVGRNKDSEEEGGGPPAHPASE